VFFGATSPRLPERLTYIPTAKISWGIPSALWSREPGRGVRQNHQRPGPARSTGYPADR